MLRAAGVTRILVDPFDLRHVNHWPGRVALDSGAYRSFKKNISIDLADYCNIIDAYDPVYDFDFTVALDAIGNPKRTMINWKSLRNRPKMMPVWQWNAKADHLRKYLDSAPVVGIGGLVPLMRSKDERMLEKLLRLCHRYPRRFHLLGMNWLKCFNELGDLVVSADTSKFLDGARYGHLIFTNTKTGLLSQCPARVLVASGHARPELLEDRTLRCIENARNMEAFCKG